MKIFNAIERFFQNRRRSGTSTLIQSIAKDHDVLVVLPTEKETQYYKPGTSCVTLYDIIDNPGRYLGTERKPILIDNSTMLLLMEMLGTEFNTMNEDIQDHNRLLNTFHRMIGEFQRGKRKYYSEMGEKRESYIIPQIHPKDRLRY